jgi:hypothetical protein
MTGSFQTHLDSLFTNHTDIQLYTIEAANNGTTRVSLPAAHVATLTVAQNTEQRNNAGQLFAVLT